MSIRNTSFFNRVGTYLQRGSNRAKLLILPLAVFEMIFFVIPMLYLLRISLYAPADQGAYAENTWSIESYVNILTDSFIHDILIFTFKYAIISTILTVVIGFLFAYAIWRSSGIKRMILLFAMVFPLLTTIVAKLYAWLLLLTPAGTINELLVGTGIIDETIPLMNNLTGAVIGQVYITLPYAVLAIFSVMTTIDWKVVEAATDLGASRPRAVWEVVVPGALPGIAVATVITWAWGVGAYASPVLLGSASERTFAVEVENRMLSQFNWPEASAMALLILLVVLASVMLLFNFLNRYGGGDAGYV